MILRRRRLQVVASAAGTGRLHILVLGWMDFVLLNVKADPNTQQKVVMQDKSKTFQLRTKILVSGAGRRRRGKKSLPLRFPASFFRRTATANWMLSLNGKTDGACAADPSVQGITRETIPGFVKIWWLCFSPCMRLAG